MDAIIIVPIVLIGLPWLVLHYVTRWKTAATLTNDDESLLEELYALSRRLDERMDTVERLVSADSPEFEPARLGRNHDADDQPLRELDRLLGDRAPTKKRMPK